MPTQQDRVEALLDKQEAAVRRRFLAFIRDINSAAVLASIADLLERGDLEGALSIVDSFIVRFADVLPTIQQVVGEATALELAATIGENLLAIGFDPSHPRAAALARASRLTLIREMIPDQRRAIRQAVGRAFDEGTGSFSTAARFRGAIGLTSGQEKWVASFEARLRNLDRRALAMELRDRRHDRTIERAILNRKPLTETQIAAMTERYRARALIYRSENIARTEALRATSQAREESLMQMIEQTGIAPERVERVWNPTRDKRLRDAHRAMDKQRRPIDVRFTDGDGNRLMWPGDPDAPPSTTVNCRCSVTFEIKPLA